MDTIQIQNSARGHVVTLNPGFDGETAVAQGETYSISTGLSLLSSSSTFMIGDNFWPIPLVSAILTVEHGSFNLEPNERQVR